MKPEEAIENNKSLVSILPEYSSFTEEGRKAIQLGIEALELYCELRQCTAIDVEDIPVRLPSEK